MYLILHVHLLVFGLIINYFSSLQYDNGLARLLFASLFNALFAEVDHHLTKEEAETTKKAVREGINTILESSQQFFPPFIGSLQVTYMYIHMQINNTIRINY